VSGIAKGDELTTVFNSLKKALDSGITFDQFKTECHSIFEKRGWTGKAAWRVDNIFRTNIQTAYNVGRYEEMQRVKKFRPFWQYSAVNDSRTRPAHLAMNGRIWPAAHKVWDIWYPPNGFRCRCSVVTLSQREVDRDSLTVETDDPTGSLVEPIDPKTGNTMPARTLLPDPGFTHHPGKIAWGGVVDDRMTAGNLTQLPDLKGASDYRLPDAGNLKHLKPTPSLLPSLDDLKTSGMSNRQASEFYRDEFRKAFDIETDARVFDVFGEPVIVSERLITGQGGRVKITKGDRGQYIPLFRDTVTDPDEIWLTPMQDDTGKIVLRRRHLAFYRSDSGNLVAFSVMDIEGGVWNGITVYDASADQTRDGESLLDGKRYGYRRGVLLHGRRK
jgi:SPP1 gp7 family putative phage head morphogenesis protein